MGSTDGEEGSSAAAKTVEMTPHGSVKSGSISSRRLAHAPSSRVPLEDADKPLLQKAKEAVRSQSEK